MRKSEGGVHERKLTTLACMVLHNVCLDNSDAIPAKLDLTTDPSTSQRRDREVIREILVMNCCRKVLDKEENESLKSLLEWFCDLALG